jgi:hypothetical protein
MLGGNRYVPQRCGAKSLRRVGERDRIFPGIEPCSDYPQSGTRQCVYNREFNYNGAKDIAIYDLKSTIQARKVTISTELAVPLNSYALTSAAGSRMGEPAP